MVGGVRVHRIATATKQAPWYFFFSLFRFPSSLSSRMHFDFLGGIIEVCLHTVVFLLYNLHPHSRFSFLPLKEFEKVNSKSRFVMPSTSEDDDGIPLTTTGTMKGTGSGTATTTVTTTNDYENPWESAANDRLWEREGTVSTMSTTNTNIIVLPGERNYNPRLGGGGGNTRGGGGGRSNRSLSFQCFQACHVLDMVWGTFLAIYTGLVLLNENRFPSIGLIILACLITLRGVVAKISRRGVSMSAGISFGLTILYLITSLVSYLIARWEGTGGKKECNFIPYTEWCHQVTLTTIALLFLICGIFEFVRYIWIRRWLLDEARQVRDDLNASEDTYRRRQSRQQPWWWQSPARGGVTSSEPLLPNEEGRPHWSTSDSRDYHMDHGGDVGTPSSGRGSWWPFSSSRRNNNNDDPTGRDDGSVDYASLNEDWASRSQEDPFWWANDDTGGR